MGAILENGGNVMRYAAALVDFDGTLADSMPWWLDLPRRTLEEAGIPEPEGFRRAIREVPMREIAVWMAVQYPELVRERTLEERWYAMMADSYRRRVTLKPGALELLSLFREKGLTVAILSATKRPLLDVALERFGLFSRVDLVLTEEEAGSKRTPEPYALLAEKLGLAMPEMLLVEDAPRNIAAAADLGLGTVGVYDASMEAWQEELRRTADVYLPDFSDLSPVRGLLEKK